MRQGGELNAENRSKHLLKVEINAHGEELFAQCECGGFAECKRKGFYTQCWAWLRRVAECKRKGCYTQCWAWLGRIAECKRKGCYTQCWAWLGRIAECKHKGFGTRGWALLNNRKSFLMEKKGISLHSLENARPRLPVTLWFGMRLKSQLSQLFRGLLTKTCLSRVVFDITKDTCDKSRVLPHGIHWIFQNGFRLLFALPPAFL